MTKNDLNLDNKEALLEFIASVAANCQSLELKRNHFYIQGKGKGKFIKILLSDIFFLESAGNYTKIHLEDKLYITHHLLKQMAENLCGPQFLRVHRSFIVNMDKVVAVDGNMIQLSNRQKVDLGPNYQKEFFKYIFPGR